MPRQSIVPAASLRPVHRFPVKNAIAKTDGSAPPLPAAQAHPSLGHHQAALPRSNFEEPFVDPHSTRSSDALLAPGTQAAPRS